MPACERQEQPCSEVRGRERVSHHLRCVKQRDVALLIGGEHQADPPLQLAALRDRRASPPPPSPRLEQCPEPPPAAPHPRPALRQAGGPPPLRHAPPPTRHRAGAR